MTWTGQSFSVGQVLTSAQMNNLQADITALANGDAGAPSIVQAAMGAASIGQAELKTTTSENTTTSTASNVTLAGGEYSFLLSVKISTSSWNAVGYGGTTGGNPSTAVTTYATIMTFGSTNAAATASIQHRHVDASPPYDLGDGLVPLFVFLSIDKATGKIVGTSTSIDGPWHNNGPTHIRTERIIDG